MQGLLGEDGAHSIGPDGPRGPGHVYQILPGGRPAHARRAARAARLARDGVARCYNSLLARRAGDARAGPRGRLKWNATCGAILRGHVDRISGIAFDATGASLVSAGFDRKAIVWDVQQSIKLGTAEPPAVPRRRDGGRADGGWRARGWCCLQCATTFSTTPSSHPAAVSRWASGCARKWPTCGSPRSCASPR